PRNRFAECCSSNVLMFNISDCTPPYDLSTLLGRDFYTFSARRFVDLPALVCYVLCRGHRSQEHLRKYLSVRKISLFRSVAVFLWPELNNRFPHRQPFPFSQINLSI